jgi:hypothetical protein
MIKEIVDLQTLSPLSLSQLYPNIVGRAVISIIQMDCFLKRMGDNRKKGILTK